MSREGRYSFHHAGLVDCWGCVPFFVLFLNQGTDRFPKHGFVQAAKEEEERKKRERLAKEALAKIREVGSCVTLGFLGVLHER